MVSVEILLDPRRSIPKRSRPCTVHRTHFGAAFTFGRALRKASTSVQDRIGEAMGMADESFGSIRTVQSFTREGIETQRFGALLHDLVGVAVYRARIRALFFGVVGFVAFG